MNSRVRQIGGVSDSIEIVVRLCEVGAFWCYIPVVKGVKRCAQFLNKFKGNTCSVVGWDPTHNRRTHDGYLTVAVGRDYLDVAPVSGTFDADRRTRARLTVDKRVEVA